MNKRQIGSYTEELAARHLEEKGYRILERNYRCRLGEIDLIALDGCCLVFAEVKYRRDRASGSPEAAVGRQKQRRIAQTAAWYLASHRYGMNTLCRFDVIAIEGKTIRHLRDAFSL